jgi:hypothetical protein
VFLITLFAAGATRDIVGQIGTAAPGGDPRIDLEIRWAIYLANQTLANAESSAAEKESARAVLEEKITVIFDYSAPVPLIDLASFVNDSRGEITWIYRASYGWNGNVARGRIPEIVASLGAGLRAVEGARLVTIDPPTGTEIIMRLPALSVEAAATVDGPFSAVTADYDSAAGTVTLPRDGVGARFFRVLAPASVILGNPRMAGDKLIFSYSGE